MAKVYCFGNTSNGELGLGGIEDDHILLPRKQKLPADAKRHKLVQLASGRNHTLVLLYNFEEDASVLLSCGSNERFQLGRQGSWKRLERVEGLDSHFIAKICCGHNHSLVLTEAGQIFAWGCNLFGQIGIGNVLEDSVRKPSLVKRLAAECVVQIACGGSHNLALTKSGFLYSWGSNAFGQLGIGQIKTCEYFPCQITAMNSVPIIQLAAGGSHSAVLSFTGSIYLWGKNEFGQLGLNDTILRSSPCLQSTLRSQKIKYLSCGDDHTAALTEAGGLYTFGAGMYGQLGHNKNGNEILPRLVFELMGLIVTQVSCGRCHTLAAVENGRVYAFGLNGSGQLGIGTSISKPFPVTVSGSWVDINVKEVTVRKMNGSVLPIVKEDLQNSPKRGASPKRSKKIDEEDKLFDMQIDEINYDTDDEMTVVSPPVVEEPEEDKLQEPSFICTPSTVIFNGLTSIQIDEYDSDFDSDNEDKLKQQTVLHEIVASRGDQSFILVTRLTEKSKPKDFRLQNSLTKICTLSDKFCETLWTLSKDEIPIDVVEYVETVFGSIPCLNASCVEKMTFNGNNPRFEWELLSRIFYYIEEADNERLNELIMQSFLRIIPELPKSIDIETLDAEVLRVFIILPFFHLLRTNYKSSEVVNLMVEFAKSIDRLNDASLKVLSDWWANLPLRSFNDLINMYKQVSFELMKPYAEQNLNFSRIYMQQEQEQAERQQRQLLRQQQGLPPELASNSNLVLPNYQSISQSLKSCLQFLENLNKVNFCVKKVSIKKFYIEELHEKIDMKWDYVFWHLKKKGKIPPEYYFLCHFPFIFDPYAKTDILHADSKIQQEYAASRSMHLLFGVFGPVVVADPYFVISVSRQNLVQETINQLCLQVREPAQFKKQLKIEFQGEEAVDAGAGMKKEFFLLLMRELLDPKYGMFTEYEETNTIWFNPGSLGGYEDNEDLVMYHLIGIVCGIAIYNQVIIYLPFPLVLYKKVLGEAICLDDLDCLDPQLAKNLKEILNSSYSEEEFNAIYSEITFTIVINRFGHPVEEELEKRGSEKTLNWHNRGEYVKSYYEFILNESIKKPFTAFKQGFMKVLDSEILKLFQAEELMQLITGQADYDWDVLEKCVKYKQPFDEHHPTIIMFWKVFRSLTLEEKKKFLFFLTGSDRIPIFGMKDMKIVISPMKTDDNHLPVAHTCFNILDLPEKYSSEEKLKQKLLLSIEQIQGFSLA